MIKKFKFEILIFLFFILSRIPDLGHDMFNTDVWKWKTRSYDFSTGVFNLQFDQTIQKYHPGVTLMWLGTLGIKIYNLSNDLFYHVSPDSVQAVFGLHRVQKLLVVAALAFTLSLIYYALKALFGHKYALLAVFLLSFEPLYIALSRVFHLEGLQSTFMLGAIVWFYYWYVNVQPIKKSDNSIKISLFSHNKRLFVASLLSAFAILTKTTALYLIPFFGLWLLIKSFNNKDYKNFFYLFFQWFITTSIFTFLFWPALWVIPLDVFKILYQGVAVVGVETEHIQYFFGKLVEDPGWYFYFVVFLFRSSYVLLIGFFAVLFTLIKNKKHLGDFYSKGYKYDFILYNVVYILFYFVMLSIPSKKLDRYILPILTSAILVGTFFYYNLFQNIKSNLKYLFLLIPLITAIYLHPNYLSYYSVGLKFGSYALEPKWMFGQSEIVKFFKDLKQSQNYLDSYDMSFEEVVQNPTIYPNVLSVGFPEKYYTQIWPFFREFGAWAVIKDLSPFAVKTNYFVYPVWEDTSKEEDRFDLTYISSIKVRGVDVYNVYKRNTQ